MISRSLFDSLQRARAAATAHAAATLASPTIRQGIAAQAFSSAPTVAATSGGLAAQVLQARPYSPLGRSEGMLPVLQQAAAPCTSCIHNPASSSTTSNATQSLAGGAAYVTPPASAAPSFSVGATSAAATASSSASAPTSGALARIQAWLEPTSHKAMAAGAVVLVLVVLLAARRRR